LAWWEQRYRPDRRRDRQRPIAPANGPTPAPGSGVSRRLLFELAAYKSDRRVQESDAAPDSDRTCVDRLIWRAAEIPALEAVIPRLLKSRSFQGRLQLGTRSALPVVALRPRSTGLEVNVIGDDPAAHCCLKGNGRLGSWESTAPDEQTHEGLQSQPDCTCMSAQEPVLKGIEVRLPNRLGKVHRLEWSGEARWRPQDECRTSLGGVLCTFLG
jgi:hypothetical protein